MRRRSPLTACTGFFLLLGGASGCSSPGAGEGDSDPVGQAAAAIDGATVISRGQEWVAAQLHYCQAANGAVDGDSSCWAWEGPSHVCNRQSNPAWDPYRSDCSGFITYAWGLPPVGTGGYITSQFAPNSSSFSYVIQGIDLQPGDAANKHPDGHIVLFKQWNTVGKEAVFLEEPGCASSIPYAHEFTSAVTINGSDVYISYQGESFTAIRYVGLTGAPPPSCQVNGVNGTCIDTSVCAGMAGYVSTPGYCPGPASEECCTPTNVPPPPPPTCQVNGVNGTCIDVSVCAGMAGYQSTPGYCPGPNSEECCTPTNAPPPTCQVNGVDGTCIDVTVCAGMPGYHSTPGYCPGPNSEECCTPDGTASTSSSSAAAGTSSSGNVGVGGATGAGGATGVGGAGTGGGGGQGGTSAVAAGSGAGHTGAGASGAGHDPNAHASCAVGTASAPDRGLASVLFTLGATAIVTRRRRRGARCS
jgi:hypothetical protein